MAARSFSIQVINLSGLDLSLKDKTLDHGIWGNNDSNTPPEDIANQSKAMIEAESQGFATGTQGQVMYSSSAGPFQIQWDNPFSGSNAFFVSVPQGYDKTYTDISGNNANVTLTLIPKM